MSKFFQPSHLSAITNGRYAFIAADRAVAVEPAPVATPAPASTRKATQLGFAAAGPAWLGKRKVAK